MQLTNSIVLTALLSSGLVSALVPRAQLNGPCIGSSGTAGTCISTASCSSAGGTIISNSCPGLPADIKCCIGATDKEPQNLPGLNAVQTKNARAIIVRAKADFTVKQAKRACYVAITAAFQDSNIEILANPKYPESLNYPHDGEAEYLDAVGIFQQRRYWGKIEERMIVDTSAHNFFNALKSVKNWQTTAIGATAQKVQASTNPEAYNQWVSKAEKVCNAAL